MFNSLYVILFFVCIGLSAFFASAETAFIGMQRLRLQHLIQAGHPDAKIVAGLIAQPEKFLATVLLGLNLFETAAAALGTLMAISLWGENLGAALATIIVTIVTLVFAELIPKSLVSRLGERIALAYARPIRLVSVILYPFVFILTHIGMRFSSMVGEASDRPTLSEEEFHTAITVGQAEGVVEEREATMLHNVFDFGDRAAREVMVQRAEVVFIEQGSTMTDFFKIYQQSPLSRFPVYKETRDNVVGTLSAKDVLMALAKGADPTASIDNLIRPAYFTPESKPISKLFAEMRDINYHFCIVVDEFGGTAGVISLSQMIEEIVGPVGDEIRGAERDFEVIDERTFQIDGGMRIAEVNAEMGLQLPEGEYETIAGFILYLLGRIPKQGEQLKYKSLKMVVTRMTGHKIEEVLVTKEKTRTESGEPDDILTD